MPQDASLLSFFGVFHGVPRRPHKEAFIAETASFLGIRTPCFIFIELEHTEAERSRLCSRRTRSELYTPFFKEFGAKLNSLVKAAANERRKTSAVVVEPFGLNTHDDQALGGAAHQGRSGQPMRADH